MAMIALKLAQERQELSPEQLRTNLEALSALPDLVRKVLEHKELILQSARAYRYASNFLYLGRGFNFPVALEGALKLKEISYIHAEGYPAAEMKHGPIALIDQFMPVVIIAPRNDPTYIKIKANIEEVKARSGSTIAITERYNSELEDLCEYVIGVPPTHEYLMPLISVIPLQLLAYMMGILRGNEVDHPRGLKKSVTAEALVT